MTATWKLGLDTSCRAEFNGADGELPYTLTTPDRAPKAMNPLTADRWQIGCLGGCGWSKMEGGDVRSKTQNAVKIMAKGGGLVAGKRGFDRLLSSNFWSLRWQRSGGKLSKLWIGTSLG